MALVQIARWRERVRQALGRIWLRLLLVNVSVVLVPVAGLEFARLYERQLLSALERDMNDQAALARALLEDDLGRGVELGDQRHRTILENAAHRTRMRVRVLSASGAVLVDSHAEGPPEGPEPRAPRLFRRGAYAASEALDASRRSPDTWPDIPERREVKAALRGVDAAQTRVAREPKAVFLFSATPIYRPATAGARQVAGAVYVTRSTTPVLLELYRIRSGLFKVLAVALTLSVSITLLLALSISQPLARLSKLAKRIAARERGVVLTVEGSGEIRELAESFRAMTEQLDARLQYISDFSSDIAHEFKSPLTSIRGAAELLAEGAHADPAARERFLRNILLDTERLDRLVTRLLELARIEASAEQMTLVELNGLLHKLVRRAEERGRIELFYGARSSWVRGRESDLEAAFSNLIDNAQRYSPDGAGVVVTAGDAPGGIAVAVCDQGPGVAEARRAKIFERFHTTDAERGGTGLGLAIVDSVAKAHGGTVSVQSELGKGSCFQVWLPNSKY
jgi:two-component system, OmpR family, sensor histidine kinase ChvG